MKLRFIELGYNAADIDTALSHNALVKKSTKLTNAGSSSSVRMYYSQFSYTTYIAWTRVSPDLERDIKRARKTRLEREHRELITTRKSVVRAFYGEYTKTLLPTQWAYMPPIEVVYDFPGIKALLFAEVSVSITAESFEDEVAILPETISEWTEGRRELLRASLADGLTKLESADQPGTSGVSGGRRNALSGAEESSRVVEDSLELATAVFTCAAGYGCMERNVPLISSEGVFRHRCRDTYAHDYTYYTGTTWKMPSFVFNAKGSRAAASVVMLAGLDVRTATPREMDELDRRFVCLGCRPGQHGAWWGFKTLTWRQCVSIQSQTCSLFFSF